MTDGLTIDWEVADKITLASLAEHHSIITRILQDYWAKKTKLHPEDLGRYLGIVESLEEVIEYYGGKV